MSFAERWVCLLLRLYPSAVRRAQGDEIVAFLAAERRHARFAAPVIGPLRFWCWATADLVRAGVHARRVRARRRGLKATAFAHLDRSHGRFGGPPAPLLNTAARDVRHAARSLLRSPLFSAAALATLALGIGAAAAAFSIVNAVLLQPLPYYEDPERIFYLSGTGLDSDNFDRWAPEFDAFSAIAVHGLAATYLRGPSGEPWRVSVMPASGRYFPIMGIPAAAGRVLLPGDDTAGGPGVAVITDRLARRRFAGADAAVGRVLTLDDRRFEVVGVLPPGFRYDAFVAEVAVAVLLLVGTVLLLRTYLILLPAQPGFAWRDRLAFRVELSERFYEEGERQRAFFDDLLERLRALPTVEEVALASDLPMTRTSDTVAVIPPGGGEENEQMVHPRSVTPGYLGLMEMPILRGRSLLPADAVGAPTPVVVNENMARFFWGGEEPLGKRFRMPVSEGRGLDMLVVGVVADAWNSPGRAESRPEVFLPFDREPHPAMAVVLRTRNPETTARVAVAAVHDLDPGVAIIGPNRRYDTPRMMADVLADAIAPWRYQLVLVAVFATAAVALTAVGLYGVLAFSVGLRRREIGVRLALGASPGAVMRLILGQGMRQVGAGLVVGVLGALAASRLLESFLYGISPLDPASYGGCAAIIVTVGAAACWSPARRAARTDPMRSLRGG